MDWWLMTGFVEVEQLTAIAKVAEESGFTGVAFSDHLVYPKDLSSKYPYTDDGGARWSADTPWPDCWVSIGAMAAVTTRLRFSTTVYIAPLRDPFNLAKATSTASVLSNGRLTCGFGAGWMEEEFELVGQPFKRRGARFDEMIEVMRLLWSGKMVEYHGECYDFPPVQMSPPSKGPIPIWIGGLNKAALQRAARNDGWIGVYKSVEETRHQVQKLNAEREAIGRSDNDFELLTTMLRIPSDDITRNLADIGISSIAVPILALSKAHDLPSRLEGIRVAGKALSSRSTPE